MDEQKYLKLREYAKLLAECKTARLTGTRGADEIYKLQILDCIPSVKFLPEAGRVIDVGTGGGLPGIIYGIMRPELEIILLDSINKKCEAVAKIINELEIKNVKIICSRSEDYAKLQREKFNFACARAVAEAVLTAEILSPFVKVGGKLLTFKGAKVYDEISTMKNKLNILGLSEPEINFYDENNNSSKCILIWNKIKPCKLKHK